MRLRDIKVGQKIRVKDNAQAFTKSGSFCFDSPTDYSLENLEGKTGTVIQIDADKTVKVSFEVGSTWYFDPVHLENVKEVTPEPVVKEISRNEELERAVTILKAQLATAVKELEDSKNTFKIADMFSREREHGVYDISGSTAKCIVTLDGEPLYVSGSVIEPLDKDSWDHADFTLTDLEPTVTFA